ncbi:MAG: hypothetical protein Q8L48_13565 [Archangium sp.]|nr:hypothetical protein [Archangium sp.]
MTRRLLHKRLEKRLSPDWETAKREWAPLKAFFIECGLDGNEAYAMAMTASELMENAIKYGTWTRDDDVLSLAIEVSPRAVVVEVENPVIDDPASVRRLDDRIQWMRGFQSPFQAYVERLKQVSSQSYQEGESGLGLCRIAYEARCLLDFYVTGTGRLAMSAVYQLGASLS